MTKPMAQAVFDNYKVSLNSSESWQLNKFLKSRQKWEKARFLLFCIIKWKIVKRPFQKCIISRLYYYNSMITILMDC